MNWNDYEALWRRQPLPRGADADLAEVKATFETKRRKLAATLWARDLVEAGAGVIVSIALGFIWWHLGRAGWPIAVAIALTLWVTARFLRERLRAHRLRLGPDASLIARLDADIAELHHQRRLLLGIWRWYLAPLGGAIVIVCLTIASQRPVWDLTRSPIFLAGYFGFVAAFSGLAWWANRRAVRRQIEPRLVELEKLRAELLET